jgi:hypothetical protein
MYILPHLCVAKEFWKLKFLNQVSKVLWIVKVLQFHIFWGMSVFLMWLISFTLLIFFSSNVFYYISPFDSPLQNWFLSDALFIFKGPKSKFKVKISSNGFLVWIPWHSYEKKTKICHDCHGFKWQNINIYPILTIFLCSLTPFLAH